MVTNKNAIRILTDDGYKPPCKGQACFLAELIEKSAQTVEQGGCLGSVLEKIQPFRILHLGNFSSKHGVSFKH